MNKNWSGGSTVSAEFEKKSTVRPTPTHLLWISQNSPIDLEVEVQTNLLDSLIWTSNFET